MMICFFIKHTVSNKNDARSELKKLVQKWRWQNNSKYKKETIIGYVCVEKCHNLENYLWQII